MSFDPKRFMKEKFSKRTEGVPVADLAAFFGEGERPEWVVRGLTGQELGRASEAADRNRGVAAIIEGLMSPDAKDKTEAVKGLMGVNETPADIAKRLEWLVLASVDPPCTLDLAVRLCETFPIEFYQLTNKIYELTGRGQVPGKQQPSGEIPKSEPASLSGTPGGDSCLS